MLLKRLKTDADFFIKLAEQTQMCAVPLLIMKKETNPVSSKVMNQSAQSSLRTKAAISSTDMCST